MGLLVALLASAAAGAPWVPRSFPSLEQLGLVELCLLAWLRQHQLTAALQQPGTQHIRQAVLNSIYTQTSEVSGVAQATTVDIVSRQVIEGTSVTTEALSTPRNRAAAVALIATICSRFQFCAKQLERRRENRDSLKIGDEYDVQDLMHAILKLHFDDVRAEEWCPSHAATSSRMGFMFMPIVIYFRFNDREDRLL